MFLWYFRLFAIPPCFQKIHMSVSEFSILHSYFYAILVWVNKTQESVINQEHTIVINKSW